MIALQTGKHSSEESFVKKRGLMHHCTVMCLFVLCLCVRLYPNEKVRVAFPLQSGFSDVGTNGNYSGYTFEYLSKIAEYTGWDIEYLTYDDLSPDDAILAAMKAVETGDADILGGLLETGNLKDMYDFCSNSYGVVYTTLAALQNNPSVSEMTFRSFSPLRVAVYDKAETRNREVEEYLKKEGVSYKIVPCASAGEQMDALEAGRADVVSSVSLSNFTGTKTLASFSARPYYFAVTKGKQKLLHELDGALESISYAFPYFQEQFQAKYFSDASGGFNLSTEQKEVIAKKKSINVLCVAHSAPFVMLDGQGKPQGVLVSMMNDFAESTGLVVNYDVYNERDIPFMQQLEKKSYDFILGIPVNRNYASGLGFIRSTPLDTIGLVVYHKAGLSKPIKECTLALVDKSDRGNYFGSKNVIYGETVEDCIRLVRDGKADVGYDNRSTVAYYDYDLYADLVMDPNVGDYADITIAVSNKGGNELLAILNNYIESISDAKLADYYASANMYGKKNAIELMARSNPVEAMLLVSAFFIAVFVSFILTLSRKKEKRQYALLSKANAAKSEFLSRMSHDIRTPMNGIMGLARMASESDDINVVHEYLKQLSSSSTYLLGLLNDILTMSRIEEGKIDLKSECVMTSSFIGGIRPVMESQAREKGVSFHIDDQSSVIVPYLYIDPLRVQQIVMNLVSNAMKFTDAGGSVRYTCSVVTVNGKRFWRHCVSDTGIGMSPSFMKTMYDPFTQERHGTQNGGTGLGLSIVKRLVGLMGGSINAESEVGKGSVFTVDLPLKEGNKEAYRKNHADKKANDSDLLGQLKGAHVLLCEDNQINTMVAVHFLEKVGCVVDTAENGQIGVEKFVSSPMGFYSFILMDIRMPVMDGLEATRAIRRMDRTDARVVPIVAMSANAFEEDQIRSLEAGMNAHVAKPVEPKVLYETLVRLVKKSQDSQNSAFPNRTHRLCHLPPPVSWSRSVSVVLFHPFLFLSEWATKLNGKTQFTSSNIMNCKDLF
jgi:signal transduction histidine kinase/CheY-like chemotaxis protein